MPDIESGAAAHPEADAPESPAMDPKPASQAKSEPQAKSKMIELIRASAVPASVMRSAARGGLSLPPAEMIEILVLLAANPVFAEQAKMTLAGFDEPSSLAVAADPNTAWEVLTYMINPENLRPKLLPALLENPSVREAAIAELAQKDSREMVEALTHSDRVRRSATLLYALMANPALTEQETGQVHACLRFLGEETQRVQAYQGNEAQEKTQWEIEHAAEIAAEEATATPFMLFGQDAEADDLERLPELAPVEAEPAAAQAAPAASPDASAAAQSPAPAAPAAVSRPAAPQVRERLSALQKISRLTVGARIQLAIRGNKEERFILVRDGSKLVAEAVLHSAKVTDSEIEMFAGMKNVQEVVLRGIARSHKFMKNYAVVRQLANNPRAPLDLSLGLLGHLMVNDLKALSFNKNIPETLRKLATKKFKEKTEKKAGAMG